MSGDAQSNSGLLEKIAFLTKSIAIWLAKFIVIAAVGGSVIQGLQFLETVFPNSETMLFAAQVIVAILTFLKLKLIAPDWFVRWNESRKRNSGSAESDAARLYILGRIFK